MKEGWDRCEYKCIFKMFATYQDKHSSGHIKNKGK